MIATNIQEVEMQLQQIMQDTAKRLHIDSDITMDTYPHKIGITSQILISVMTRLENALKVIIPENCYIFHDTSKKEKLSLRQAAKKLMKIARNVS